MKNMTPNMANEMSVSAMLAPVKDMFLKNLKGNMGSDERHSDTAKAASRTTAAPKA